MKDWVVIDERSQGLSKLLVISRKDDKDRHYIDFGEATYSAGTGYNPEYESDVVRYHYESLTTPDSTYDYDMNTRSKTLRKQRVVVGDFNRENYHTERKWAKAKDGTLIPVSIVHRKDLKVSPDTPL